MKKKLSMLAVVLFLVAIGASTVFAYDITIIPGGTQDITGQSTIYFDIVFNPDPDGNVLEGYGFNLLYDATELTWNQTNTSETPPLPLTVSFGGAFEVVPDSGLIQNFNGNLPFGQTPPLVTAPVTLASVAFDVDAGINNPADGSADVWFDTSTAGFRVDGTYVTMSQINISGTTPDVYVLPEPISIILFIAGGATFGIGSYLRKRKQRLAA